ncbi:MAG: SDR family oxidoreductase, partial [Anaerolineae bacterium]|nr:SDR family oxidoreductase [Anaerolineae bacterium]
VALVTGGSSGIGRAAALAFARAGARVVIAARQAERGQAVAGEVEALGGSALFVQTDVSRGHQVAALVERVVDVYGRLDCAFNNAAEVAVSCSLANLSEDDYDQQMTANLKSVWLCMKYEIQQMLRQSPVGGVIVNTSSVNGLGGVPTASLYAAAKAGVLALTKSAALEYATQGIRVNAVVAGAFRTPMLEGVMDRLAEGDTGRRQAVEAYYARLIPLGRVGYPDEAAQAAVWLCSDAASYVTGHSMIVDGGMSAAYR